MSIHSVHSEPLAAEVKPSPTTAVIPALELEPHCGHNVSSVQTILEVEQLEYFTTSTSIDSNTARSN